MALTNIQKKAIKEVHAYSYDSELNNLCNWMDEHGYTDAEITKFLGMSFGGKIMFMQSSKKEKTTGKVTTTIDLTSHIFYHLLILKTIG
jgi:hypothetical protein